MWNVDESPYLATFIEIYFIVKIFSRKGLHHRFLESPPNIFEKLGNPWLVLRPLFIITKVTRLRTLGMRGCGEVVRKYSFDPVRRLWSSASHLKEMNTPVGGARISTPTDKSVSALLVAYISSYTYLFLHAFLWLMILYLYYSPWALGSGPPLIHCMYIYSAFILLVGMPIILFGSLID